jgi:hypothetical protein
MVTEGWGHGGAGCNPSCLGKKGRKIMVGEKHQIKARPKLGAVAYTYISYWEGRDQEDHNLRPAQAKKLMRLHLNQ